MTSPRGTHPGEAEYDVATPDMVERRFGIEKRAVNVREATATFSMPVAGLLNPFTGQPTSGPLAILVDAAGGTVNFCRRPSGQRAVSSELTVEFNPDCVIDADPPVVVTALPLGATGATALSRCMLTHGDVVVGVGIVRSFYVPTTGPKTERAEDTLNRTAGTSLAELMAVAVRPAEGRAWVLAQVADPSLNNGIGIVHGGVASAGLELVASAAANGLAITPRRTTSLRVNFLRPFMGGNRSRYLGTALDADVDNTVVDARAIGDDGRVAVTARVTTCGQ